MRTDEILTAIDKQIAQWQEARALIAGGTVVMPVKRGRPKGSANKAPGLPAKGTKRVMSAEGKARIAAAQKLRWSTQKRATKSSAKSTTTKKAAKKTSPAE